MPPYLEGSGLSASDRALLDFGAKLIVVACNTASGAAIDDPDQLRRIEQLVIPPAWQEVWICPYPNGHIQAVGVDAAGRRQYLYHPEWRVKRDKMKFDRVTEVAAQLPRARAAILEHIALDGMPMERAAATAVRLLDRRLVHELADDDLRHEGSPTHMQRPPSTSSTTRYWLRSL